MTEKKPIEKTAEQAQEYVENILHYMGFDDATLEISLENEEVQVDISHEDAARLIGKNAQVLNALQFVVNRMIFSHDNPGVHCVVDVERYRARRKERILNDTYEAVDKAIKTGRPVKLSPMSAAERRIVHQELKDNPKVETHSEIIDSEHEKQVIISPT